MKKLILLSLITLLCLPLAVYAASMGGVETQGQGKFAIGMDQEFVFDRDMKNKSVEYQEEEVSVTGTAKTEVDKMYRTMAKVSYGVLDNLDVYVKLGTADVDIKQKASGTWAWGADTGTWDESSKLKGENGFAYGFGVKGTYPLKNDWIIGCDVQYLRHKNDFKGTDTLTAYNAAGEVDYTETGTVKGDATFQEWQVAPYIAKKIGNFVPYLGGKYSGVSVKAKIKYEEEDGGEAEKIKFRADDHFGVFLGTDYKIGESWKLNIEGRFIDETAMSFGATYRF